MTRPPATNEELLDALIGLARSNPPGSDDQPKAPEAEIRAAVLARMMPEWRPMTETQKSSAPILLMLKNPIPHPDRDDLRRWDGLCFVGRHPGVADDGFDIGWMFAAPVGCGGFSDDWFVGWMPLPAHPHHFADVTKMVDGTREQEFQTLKERRTRQ